MKSIMIVGGLIGLTLLGAGMLGHADDDRRWFGKARQDVAPVANARYAEECGACHFAYQPGLLPAASWKRIMVGLEEHFGDNAELDVETARTIGDYLAANAADRSAVGRSPAIARRLDDTAPLRFTTTAYFRREHHELPAAAVSGNAAVRSFSNCQACHTRAGRGDYDEHGVRIPGYGHWDD